MRRVGCCCVSLSFRSFTSCSEIPRYWLLALLHCVGRTGFGFYILHRRGAMPCHAMSYDGMIESTVCTCLYAHMQRKCVDYTNCMEMIFSTIHDFNLTKDMVESLDSIHRIHTHYTHPRSLSSKPRQSCLQLLGPVKRYITHCLWSPSVNL